MNAHITDLLNAAKLVADREDNTLLSYLIAMALIEARSVATTRSTKIASAA